MYTEYKKFELNDFFHTVSAREVENIIHKDHLDIYNFASLLSPEAENYLEDMAEKAHGITMRYFGKTIQLYTPVYLSNYCDNQCAYCGFNSKNNVERRKLNRQEIEKEAQFVFSTGLRHILVLTGESRKESSVEYIKECIRILKEYFSSISIEVYALTEKEYADIVSEGVDGLTIYQEVYDEEVYDRVHCAGAKKNYIFRLDAPERGARGGMRSLNIGVLLGLNDWRKETFFMGLHAKYLQEKFPDVEIAVSIPRLRPHVGDFNAMCGVSDKNIVQIVLALRIFLPRLGISVSTRESPEFRKNLIPLGITRMSAGSTTRVGGHTLAMQGNQNSFQFEISDQRNVNEIKVMLKQKGYQPVLKDWVRF